MKIKVLYEDSNILAIDKPSGISVHPAAEEVRSRADAEGKGKQKFVTDWVIKNYPKMKNIGESQFFEDKGVKVEIKRPGIVHRLDRETSGVMLLAKNQKSYEALKKQFADREVKKTYLAVVSGFVRDDRGVINKPIGRSPRDFRRYLSGRGARGEMREAETSYRVLKRFTSPQPSPYKGEGVKYTYLEVKPKTGRTHQIRVHMKYLNHPVVGDMLYNPNGPLPSSSGPLTQTSPLVNPPEKREEKGGGRMFLHAKSIEFKDLKGKTIKVESTLPKEFLKVVKSTYGTRK